MYCDYIMEIAFDLAVRGVVLTGTLLAFWFLWQVVTGKAR